MSVCQWTCNNDSDEWEELWGVSKHSCLFVCLSVHLSVYLFVLCWYDKERQCLCDSGTAIMIQMSGKNCVVHVGESNSCLCCCNKCFCSMKGSFWVPIASIMISDRLGSPIICIVGVEYMCSVRPCSRVEIRGVAVCRYEGGKVLGYNIRVGSRVRGSRGRVRVAVGVS